MLRFLADENFDRRVVLGLLRRSPDCDILRVQDAFLSGKDDPAILAWAAEQGRIVVTHDVNTMTSFACDRIDNGERMPGLFVVRGSLPVGRAIAEMLLLLECSMENEWDDQIVYVPLE